jgi:hypothetical protein
MIAAGTMVRADSIDLEIILGCSLGIIFGLAIIITITVIAGVLIKAKFKGNYYLYFQELCLVLLQYLHIYFSFNYCVL